VAGDLKEQIMFCKRSYGKYQLKAVLLLLILCTGCTEKKPAETNQGEQTVTQSATIDAIEKSGRLWGVEEVQLNKDGSVTLKDTMHSGEGVNLMMINASNASGVDSVDLLIGQSCSLSDGHHVFITYKLKSIIGNVLTFMVTDKFDARAFGDNIKIAHKEVAISPYVK
jgi:hypothetical protein